MPVTHVLHNGPVKVLESSKEWITDPRGSLANEIPSCTKEQANQRWLPFTNEMVSIHTGNGGNHEYNCPSKTTIHKHP